MTNGLKYDVLTFTRIEPLKAGAMTEWNVINYVGIGKNVTSADIQTAVEKGFIKVLEDGTMTVNVLVQADAIRGGGLCGTRRRPSLHSTRRSNCLSRATRPF